MPGAERILVSCEHAGNRVPRRWAPLFVGAGAVLRSHRGWDPGAMLLARRLARSLDAPLRATPVTRLLVDTNRSLHHRHLFSEFTSSLGRSEREAILEAHYRPHRREIEEIVSVWIDAGARVLHLAVHSFDPSLAPERGRCDLGLLYDPRRRREREAARRWQARLGDRHGLRVRLNFPYRGVADGLTRHLRTRFGASAYAGVEIEANQARLADPAFARRLAKALADAIGPEARRVH